MKVFLTVEGTKVIDRKTILELFVHVLILYLHVQSSS
jgi:hypothetical protein